MKVTNTFGSFLVSLLSASLAAGAVVPAVPRADDGAFEIKQVTNKKYAGKNGPLALARAYNKFNVSLPEDLAKAVDEIKSGALPEVDGEGKDKRSSGSAAAYSLQDDLEYVVNVNIGTPAQTLQLDFDTGSSDLWVFSSETPAGERSGHSIYTPGRSSTAQKLNGETWSIQYQDGSGSSGDVYSDRVTIGGLTVSGQAVESATQVSDQFASGGNDGLLGLGFSTLNTVTPDRQQTWFDNVGPQLSQDLFVADLRHESTGSYTFGSIPSGARNAAYTGISTQYGVWEFGTYSDLTGSYNAIADTGTTLLLVNNDLINAYYGQTQSAYYSNQVGGVVVDCNEQLPDFYFYVGGSWITVPGSFVQYASVGNGYCYGGIQGNQGLPFAIFGDIALKAAYVVFDKENQSIGWAQKV